MLTIKKRFRQVGMTYFADFLGIFLSFLLAYWVRFSEVWIPTHKGLPPLSQYLRALWVVIPVYLWVFRSYGLYQVGRHIRRVEEIFHLLKGIAVGTVILMAFSFFYREFSYSRLFLVFLWLFASLMVSLFRYLLIQWLYHIRRQSKDFQRVLIVGSNRNARTLIEWANQNPHLGYRIEGVLVQEKELIGKHLEGIPIVGSVEEGEKIIEKIHPDEVIVTDADLPKDKLTDFLLRCENGFMSFKVASDLYGIVSSNLDVEYVGSVPLLGFKPLPLDDLWSRVTKRTFDLFVSSSLFIFLSPVFILAALTVKLTDGGDVFYKQERVGQDGRNFTLFKFRTMRSDAEQNTGPVWAKKQDDRCTTVGGFLRRFNIDELPQLWNVLRSDMSLVGPRPERPHFVNQFRDEIPRYMTRHKIKSGITGWAQVNGLRGNTSLQERIKYDLYYAENWSLLFDLEILFMTLFAFKNAY